MSLAGIEATGDALEKDQIEQPLLCAPDEDLGAGVGQQFESSARGCLSRAPIALPCIPVLGENQLDVLCFELERPRNWRRVVNERIGPNEDLPLEIDADEDGSRDAEWVDGYVNDTREITTVLDLEPVLVGRPVLRRLGVGKEGI